MKKLLTLILSAAIIVGCNDDEIMTSTFRDQETANDGRRLAFKDTRSFFETLDRLDAMSFDELNAWEKNNEVFSMKKYIESIQGDDTPFTDEEQEYIKLPSSYLMLLNKNGEVRIGDTIVWYSKGVKYYALNENQMQSIRKDPSKSLLTNTYTIQRIAVPENAERLDSPNGLFEMGAGGLAAGYQRPFKYCYNNTDRKYVNELAGIVDNVINFPGNALHPPGYTFRARLYLRMKLEWKGSGSWKTAGEYRFINYNLTTTISFNFNPGFGPVADYGTKTWTSPTVERNSQLDVLLQQTSGTSFNYGSGTSPRWTIQINGSIYQAISNKIPAAPGGLPCNPFTIGGPGVALDCFISTTFCPCNPATNLCP